MIYAERKSLGAFYTDASVADFIVRWASPDRGTVLDPSCGDGVFLASVSQYRPDAVALGVEINKLQAAATRAALGDRARIIDSDFFDFYPDTKLDAIVGNPPFIRYQALDSMTREKALFRCRIAGVKLSKLSSSWAYFVVVAAEMLKSQGRLGLVLPNELLHANYAKPVLQYLARSFQSVTIVTFKKRLFPDLSQDTLLLLASGRGTACGQVLHVDADSIGSLEVHTFEQQGREVNATRFLDGEEQIKETLVDPLAISSIKLMRDRGAAYRLGDRFSSDIGYVTGANEFFHVTSARARELRLPQSVLSPAIFRGRALSGLIFDVQDWMAADKTGESGYLFHVTPGSRMTSAVRSYIEAGERADFHKRFKCRIRSKWYVVPHVYRPEAFLTSMSGERPYIVVNEANVVSSNSLHILRSLTKDTRPQHLASAWLSSITALSIELEGHALGGGMLKLEPKESERVVVPDIHISTRQLRAVDRELRQGDDEAASAIVDQIVGEQLGLSDRRLKRIQGAVQELRERRRKKRR